MMKRFSLALLFMVGCGGAWSPVSPSSGPEEFILGETTRFATKLRVKVRGELTDTVYSVMYNGVPTPAAGWYDRGVAYYYRPYIAKQTNETCSAIAAHEVCHAVEYFHNEKHEACIQEVMR